LQRIRELDGLRGLAVAMVVMGHYVHHPSLKYFGPQWGWMGVDLFFVLSGFLITSILLRTVEKHSTLKTFYARRTLRIFPLYYLVLGVYFLASASVGRPQPWNTTAIYLFFMQAILPPTITHLRIVPHPGWTIMGFSVLWSLSVEEMFYLLWAPLVVFTRARRKFLLRFLFFVLLLAPLLRFFPFFYADPRGIQETFLGQMDSLAAGALIAVFWRDHAEFLRPWAQEHARHLHLLCVALIGSAIWIDLATGIPYKTPLQMRLFDASAYTLLWAAWGTLLLATLACSGLPRTVPGILRNRVLVWLGQISYCLYLVHYPIYLFWRDHLPHSVALPVALATSLAVASLSWKYMEGPILRWEQSNLQP
jgi:peptidoglycan/LPS O-acetylase OafA/YrhL